MAAGVHRFMLIPQKQVSSILPYGACAIRRHTVSIVDSASVRIAEWTADCTQSTFAPEAFTTCAHLTASALIILVSPPGVVVCVSNP